MKEKLSMVVFVVVLGCVLTSALVAVDKYTAGYIKVNQLRTVRRGVLEALGIPYPKSEVDRTFLERVETRERSDKTFYVAKDGGQTAFRIDGSGLWGPIEAIVALRGDLRTIKGIAIIHQEETPGLGGRIAEKDFLNRFNGKIAVPEVQVVRPGTAKGDSEVDGITGATLSCIAFQEILNSQIAAHVALIEEGN